MGFAIRRTRDLGTTSPLPTGVVSPFAGTTAPTGWLLCAGQEIEIASYGDLYGVLGTTYGALTNGAGGAGSTHFRVPDLRGRIPAGKDDMGGSAASRLTNTTITSGATTLGNSGGAQTHTLTSGESGTPAHQHPNTLTNNAVNTGDDSPGHTHSVTSNVTLNDPGHVHAINARPDDATSTGSWYVGAVQTTQPVQASDVASNSTGISITNNAVTSGGRSAFHQHSVTSNVGITNANNTAANASSAHNNVQPTLILNYIIKA